MKLRNKKIKQENGITLIALVVTIVVLLILAGVSINALFNENGLIKKAQDAQNKMNEAQNNDLKALSNLEQWINSQEKGTNENGTSDGKDESTEHTIISFTLDGITLQAEEGMTWRQAVEAGYFDDTEKTEQWYEQYGSAEKQLYNGKYEYAAGNTTTDYIITDAKCFKVAVYSQMTYVFPEATFYYKADKSVYNIIRTPQYGMIIPTGSQKSSTYAVKPDDQIVTNGSYDIYNDD